ncbi:MAG: LysM peptidoglycan-binding domain-containing protein [Alphaproteobacteria bacterium]|nr:LysM peptidoglycan-binding domain-containing protein [Alphaproteobacteria bacterium]
MLQTACDLQPKILSLPDSVGEFISQRYPALLADPNVNPEIYNSAVTDYGMYASPDLYGRDVNDNYVVYASVDDYIVSPQNLDDEKNVLETSEGKDGKAVEAETQKNLQVAQSTDYLLVPMYGGPVGQGGISDVVVQPGDTLYRLAQKHSTTVDELAKLNGISEPFQLQVGQKLKVPSKTENQIAKDEDVLKIARPMVGVQTVTRVGLTEITVQPGDTLYSLSRKYSMPVNDLAVLNNLMPPFSLNPGQKLRVPDLGQAPVAKVAVVEKNVQEIKPKKIEQDKMYGDVPKQKTSESADKLKSVKEVPTEKKQSVVAQDKTEPKKISSDPNKKLPKITARSSSQFSWPVRGKILSNYGSKASGLFNDGINIAAKQGTTVMAAENGVVAYAGNEVKGMGNLIIIQHDGGWMTVYAHMDSLAVKRGTKVKVGQKIGTVGKTGKVDSTQLHFEIRKGTKAYNPTQYMKK